MTYARDQREALSFICHNFILADVVHKLILTIPRPDCYRREHRSDPRTVDRADFLLTVRAGIFIQSLGVAQTLGG